MFYRLRTSEDLFGRLGGVSREGRIASSPQVARTSGERDLPEPVDVRVHLARVEMTLSVEGDGHRSASERGLGTPEAASGGGPG
jgi:hypothetical protein